MIPYGIAISAILHTNPGRFAMQSCQDCYNCLETKSRYGQQPLSPTIAGTLLQVVWDRR